MTKFMSEKNKILQKGSTYNGFSVLNVFELNDFHSTAFYLRHEKTGLEVLHLLNDETENLFSFSFRTPNFKGNGLAHIMEHSVLCGSEKYPLKDPFTQLSNQSVKTYLNAATYADKTVYPASSTVEADYFNLMSVYGDAVFFPKLSPEIFAQEAYRLDFADEKKPSIQGVVYNEMKGVYSSFEEVASGVPSKNLLKGTIYEKDSGGDPVEIPTLTYEEYLEFHKKWYRAENCFVFLYGNIPTQKQLDFLQENFLNRLQQKKDFIPWNPNVKSQILKNHFGFVTPQNLETPLFVKEYGPSGEENEKGSTVLLTWNLGPSCNAFETMEKVLVTGILLNHDGSPLQKALIESGLGEDTAPGMGLNTFYSVLFTVGLRGVKKNAVEKVKDVVFKTLREIVEKGIEKDDIDSTLMALEFSHREIRRSHGPYAISLMQSPINAWAFGNDIEKSFRLRSIIEEVRIKIQSEKGYLEQLINKFFLNNDNYIITEVIPSKKYNQNREKCEKKLIKNLLKKTSVEKIKEKNAALKSFQTKKDDSSCLPHLKPQDFIKDGKRLSDNYALKIKTLEGSDSKPVDFFVSSENTNGITYFEVGFPVDVLDAKDYLWLPLLADTITDCGWGNLDWIKAASITALNTGGISANLLPGELCKTQNSLSFINEHNFCGRDWLVFKLKVIDEKIEQGLKLLSDNINLVDFKDTKRLKDIAIEARNDIDSSIIPGGHQYAILRAARKFSKVAAIDEIWNGLTLFYNLHTQAENSQTQNAQIFNRIFKEIKQGGGFVHITAEEQTLKKVEPLIKKFVKDISLTKLKEAKKSTLEDFVSLTEIQGVGDFEGDEYFVIPGQIGFAAQAFSGIAYGQKGNAVIDVCTHWLSNILLWERIRTVGGAYGAYCETDSISGRILFATYRDPSPEKSNDVFDSCLKDASQMEFSQSEVEKAVMGTYSQFVAPKTPQARGYIELLRTLYAIDERDRENKLFEILNCSKEDFKSTLKKLSDFSMQRKYRVIIGSEKDGVSGKKIYLPL
ncbi:insulinase family protein [Treponema pectinovorum]|uniref:insulinase family protein n=1 Tax=Treponema pectinovorum TaxID=164 RepID=UPI001659CD2B|nr:insulinase family protein [Treponema pectinovorum]